MDSIVYNSITSYFNNLKNLGYTNYNDVFNLLFLIAIQEFIYNDFRGLITEEDYRLIEKALYKIFGTSCLVPYPNYCNNTTMNKLHLGDITELANRVKVNEENIEEIQNTKVVKTSDSYEKDIDDLVINK
jgi:hypothetical protein